MGEYRIDRYLGSGGFGITYLATDENLNLQVAIKEYLPSDFAVRGPDRAVVAKTAEDEDEFERGRKRFREEAHSLARFDHPNIVPVQRYLVAHGTSYIVMDYVKGEPLSELLKRKGTLTEAEIRRSVLPIADGLAEVHRAGLLHRDIKPANIVVRTDGTPVLIDFGAARQATGKRSRSVTSVVTPGYAPPEQYGTKSRQEPATDIYGLGAVLYHCVTGRSPDDASDRLMNDELATATQSAAHNYGKELLAAIDSALALRMEHRPQSVAEFLDEMGFANAPNAGHRPHPPPTQVKVAGLYFLPPSAREAAEKLRPGDLVALEREPLNLHDRHAVRVSVDGTHIGYLPREVARSLKDEDVPEQATYVRTEQAQVTVYPIIKWDPAESCAPDSHESGSSVGASPDNTKRKPKLNLEEATEAYVRGDYATALPTLQHYAKSGNANAQFRLGLMYRTGEGVPKDPARAAHWFRKAAEQGNLHAQGSLGFMYRKGEGVPKDYVQAFAWLTAAANRGNLHARSMVFDLRTDMLDGEVRLGMTLSREIERAIQASR